MIKVLLGFLLIATASCAVDSIFSVTASKETVSNSANLTIVLGLASTATTIQFSLPSQYQVHTSKCLVNRVAAACTLTAVGNQYTLTFSGSFSSQPQFQFEVVNPIYEAAFQMFCYNGGVMIGSGSVMLQTVAFQSSCSLSSSSSVVAASATGTFQLNVPSVPAGSNIYLTFPKQTVFQDIITNLAGISCTSATAASTDCKFSYSDLSTYSVQVTGMFAANFVGGNVSFTLTPINNPPYNDTFGSIDLQLTDQNSNRIAYCSCQQQAPSQLAASNVLYDGWNSAINQLSTVSMRVIPKTSLPVGFQLLLVYPLDLTIQANPPAVQTLTTNATSNTLWLNNLTLSSGRVSLAASMKNPSAVKQLPLTIYTTYNSTEFIEVVSVTNLTLTIASVSITAVLANNYVMSTTTLTLNGSFTDPILSGFLTLKVDRGSFVCSATAKINGTTVIVANCTNNSIVLQGSAQNTTSITVGYTTPLSEQPANINISSASSTNQPISFGSSPIYFVAGPLQFTVTNANLTFGSRTFVTLQEVNNSFIKQERRNFTVVAPSNMNITGLTVTGVGLNTFSFNSSTNTVLIDYYGLLNVTLIHLQNPTLYDGNRNWSITSSDSLGYPVSSGIGSQTVEYTPTTATAAIQLSNTVIEQNTTSTTTLRESMAHLSTDYILIRVPNATIVNPCVDKSCTVSNGAIRFAFSSGLIFQSQLTSALSPGSYSITVEYYTIDGLLLENGTASYQLTPMTYVVSSSFSGFMGQQGVLDLNLTTRPSTSLQVTYSVSKVMDNPSCSNCSSSRQLIVGTVVYFTTANITLVGSVGSVVYATGTVAIDYPCTAGCHICTTSTCVQCFDAAYSSLIYFYKGSCLGSCPLATYTSATSCVDCQQNCYNCNATGCNICSSGFFLYQSQCINSCPSGFAVVNGECVVKPISCPTACLSCTASDSCQKCNDTYILYQNLCYTDCPGNLTLQNKTCVVPPEPPVQSTHFPFPFAVASICLFVILCCFKCFDKRSMIIGNFISGCTLLQFGCILMFLSYLLMDNRDLGNQLLTYLCILSKVACNIFMLVYFMKKISRDTKFEEWLGGDVSRNHMKVFVMVMSALFSFQFYRFLYSRLLGLEIFFARFSSPLMLKPMSYLTYGYAVVASGSLIALAVRSIVGQYAVHTSVFWACVEIIFIELVMFVACVIDDQKKSDEHFDYQIYKIDNDFEAMGVPNAKQQSMSELGGNLFQPVSLQVGTVNNLQSDSESGSGPNAQGTNGTSDPRKPKGLKNIFEMDSKAESGGQSAINGNKNTHNNAQTGNNSVQQEEGPSQANRPQSNHYSRRSIFRKKTLDEWNNFKSGKNRSTVVIGTDGKNKSLSPSRSQAQLPTSKSQSIDKEIGATNSHVGEGEDAGSGEPGAMKHMGKIGKSGSQPKLQPVDGASGIPNTPPTQQPSNRKRPNYYEINPSHSALNLRKGNEQGNDRLNREAESLSKLARDESQRNNNHIGPRRNIFDEQNKDQTQKDIMQQLGGEDIDGHEYERNMLERELEESIKVAQEEGLDAIAPLSPGNVLDQDSQHEPNFGGANNEQDVAGQNGEDGDQGELDPSSAAKLAGDPNEYNEFINKRRSKKKKNKKSSRYKNTSIEEIYLQRLSASVTKPLRKLELETDF